MIINNLKTSIPGYENFRLHVREARKKTGKNPKTYSDICSIRFSSLLWKDHIHHEICIYLEGHWISSPKMLSVLLVSNVNLISPFLA